jgi:hypothetical protein
MPPLSKVLHCYNKLPLLLQEEKDSHVWCVAVAWHCVEGDPHEEGNLCCYNMALWRKETPAHCHCIEGDPLEDSVKEIRIAT